MPSGLPYDVDMSAYTASNDEATQQPENGVEGTEAPRRRPATSPPRASNLPISLPRAATLADPEQPTRGRLKAARAPRGCCNLPTRRPMRAAKAARPLRLSNSQPAGRIACRLLAKSQPFKGQCSQRMPFFVPFCGRFR